MIGCYAERSALSMGAERADLGRVVSADPAPHPARVPACPHDERQPMRQSCRCCGVQDHLNFGVSDEVWAAVVPEWLRNSPLCLRCFDALAAHEGVNYADALTEMWFAGDGATFQLVAIRSIHQGKDQEQLPLRSLPLHSSQSSPVEGVPPVCDW